MKTIILARVSTEEQKEAGNSLPAQQARLISYVKRNSNLELTKEFIFDESAYKEHRKEFNKVLEFIEKQKETVALCCDKVDRLSRDFLVGLPALEKLRREGKIVLHFPSDNLILHKDSPATDLFHFNIAVSLAQYYSNSISDNVKRAYEYKIRHGEWIGKPRLGYIKVVDENGNKDHIPDPARAHLVVKMFELYATGNYSIRTLAEEIRKLGLKGTVEGKPISTGMVFKALKDPFYYGMMRIKGELYPHKYEPLISKELFDKVQQIRLGYHKKPFKYASKPFIFRGLVKCADERCGCTITAEIHKGHNYYSCTNYKRIHPKRIYVREEDLLSPINEVLKNIRLSDEKIQEITEDLKKINQAKNEFHTRSLANLRKEYDLIQTRISNSYDAMADGSITKDMFNKKLKEYKEKQVELEVKMEQYTDADENFYLTANMMLNLAKKAYEIFQVSEVSEKRQLLNFLLQNLKLQGKNLVFELKTPFDTVLQASKCSNLFRGLDSNQDLQSQSLKCYRYTTPE